MNDKLNAFAQDSIYYISDRVNLSVGLLMATLGWEISIAGIVYVVRLELLHKEAIYDKIK